MRRFIPCNVESQPRVGEDHKELIFMVAKTRFDASKSQLYRIGAYLGSAWTAKPTPASDLNLTANI